MASYHNPLWKAKNGHLTQRFPKKTIMSPTGFYLAQHGFYSVWYQSETNPKKCHFKISRELNFIYRDSPSLQKIRFLPKFFEQTPSRPLKEFTWPNLVFIVSGTNLKQTPSKPHLSQHGFYRFRSASVLEGL